MISFVQTKFCCFFDNANLYPYIPKFSGKSLIQCKVPKGICTSRSPQEVTVRAFSERDQSESRMRLCSCSICSSCLLLDAWLVSKFISTSLSS